MEYDDDRAYEELQKTLVGLMNENVPCEDALIAMADLTSRIALENYQGDEVLLALIGRMEKRIREWKGTHVQ